MQMGARKPNFGKYKRGVGTFKEFKRLSEKIESEEYTKEYSKEEYNRLKRELERKEKALNRQKEELDKKQHMFEMQWKLLEHEVSMLAMEKEAFYKEKKEYKHAEKTEKEKTFFKFGQKSNASMYFLGVNDELSLKKRYRDLLKMFHPDNMCGDLDAMQEINKEYAKLKKKYEEF